MNLSFLGKTSGEILAYIGFFYLAIKLVAVLGYLIRLLRRQLPQDLSKTYGLNSWALITGGSDGIGKGFAKQMAQRGFNLILLARSKEKLDNTAKEIKQMYPSIEVKIVLADLVRSGDPDYLENSLNPIKDLDISMIVNNAGFDVMAPFHESNPEDLRAMICVNVFPYVLIVRSLIDKLRQRSKKSAIISVSSLACVTPMPYFGTYGATKIFEDHFSKSLQIEYPNIDFISLRPSFVSTKLNLHKKVGYDTISPEECAEGCLRELGHYEHTYAHIKHELAAWVLLAMPKLFRDFFSKNIAIPMEWRRREKIRESRRKKE